MLVGRWTDSSEPEFQKINIAYNRKFARYYTDKENFDLLARFETFNNEKMLVDATDEEGIAKIIHLQRYFDSNTAIMIKDRVYVNPAYFKQDNFRKMLPDVIEEGFERFSGIYRKKSSNLINFDFKRKFENISDKDVSGFFMDVYKKYDEKSIQRIKKSTEEVKGTISKLRTDVFLNK